MSDKVKLREGQVELIERMAALEKGMPPAASKVLALLFVSDEVELTFDKIKDTLNLSKGATSQAINHLILTKKIDSISHLGDRKRYFKSRVSGWRLDMDEVFQGLTHMVETYKDVLKQRPTETAAFNLEMAGMIDFLDYIIQGLIAEVRKYPRK